MIKHRVELTYFKNSGKYYISGFYFSDKEHMFEIFEEVKEKKNNKTLPDLSPGSWDGPILVESKNNPNGYPGLIMPDKN